MARILIVDDEKENREALTRALQDDNPEWEVMSAPNEFDGEYILQQQVNAGAPIDVVLTDLVMKSEASGMTMLQRARQLDPLVMAILFTAKEKSLDRYAAFDFGAFDVVEKNIRGVAAVREINIKTRAALRYREWSLRIGLLRRYFDPTLFNAIEQDLDLLNLAQRTVTVCFWDIRGFSLLCEILKAHPSLIAGFLREYCDIAARVVFDNGGVLDKFIGDGVMALFGAMGDVSIKTSCADAAVCACKAGLDLRCEFNGLYSKWLAEWKKYTPQSIEIGLGCGIHTGEVLVGNVGTSFRDQFTALGPHVNFAARIEGRSKANQILVSQSTEAHINAVIATNPAERVDDIKNIPGVFQLYEVINIK